jgi:hypothetical protein
MLIDPLLSTFFTRVGSATIMGTPMCLVAPLLRAGRRPRPVVVNCEVVLVCHPRRAGSQPTGLSLAATLLLMCRRGQHRPRHSGDGLLTGN